MSNIRFISCDPDVRSSAFSIMDINGKLIDAWVVKAKDIQDSAKKHALHLPKVERDTTYIASMESQQFYNNTPRNRVKSLLQLARACGVAMTYLATHYSSPELILPREWTNKGKLANQYWILKNMGLTPIRCAGYCAAEELIPKYKKTEQKHLVDSFGINLFAIEKYKSKN